MPTVNHTETITAKSTGDAALTDWLHISQDRIDERFNSVTVQKLRQMLGVIMGGGSPYDVLTQQCPVRRRVTPDGVIASYTATVLVDRSASLEGKYNLTCDGYEVRGPYKTTRSKAGEIWTEGREVVELGWLPRTFTARQTWGPTIPLTWTQENGFFHPEAGEAMFKVSGTADLDRWTILVEHQQGQPFTDTSLPVDAWWGDNQQAHGEILIPGCVLAALKECPNLSTGGLGDDDPATGEYWFQLNPTRYVYYNGCTGEILLVTYDEDDQETIT